jgi:hypothetical protein
VKKIRIRNEHPRPFFQENSFWVKNIKIVKFFDADPGFGIRNIFDPGSGMEKLRSGIRHKHPDPQHSSGYLYVVGYTGNN